MHTCGFADIDTFSLFSFFTGFLEHIIFQMHHMLMSIPIN